jgi:hypothetical protein
MNLLSKIRSFVCTRARATDCDTSHKAAKNAASGKASIERKIIRDTVKKYPTGLTAKEVACITGIEYIEVQRRISECGLTKTELRRDGCAVWSTNAA